LVLPLAFDTSFARFNELEKPDGQIFAGQTYSRGIKMRINQKIVANKPTHERAANQTLSDTATFRRVISCALLGENQFYVNGIDLMQQIAQLAASISHSEVLEEARKARHVLGLRHTPLFLLNLIAARPRTPEQSRELGSAVFDILRTPRDAMDLVALYFTSGNRSLPYAYKQVIKECFEQKWTGYQLAKYATLKNVSVRLRDVMALSHPKPQNEVQANDFSAIRLDTIRAPDTWESALSVPGVNKCQVWERLLSENRLAALALVRNLRNMEAAGVDPKLIRGALATTKATDIWPWQAIAAAKEAPGFAYDLSEIMVRSASGSPRIPGNTFVLVDVSGAMNTRLSNRG